jgi:hypothetical protein
MRRGIDLTIVAVLVCGMVAVAAQGRPSFAGSWALVDTTARSQGVAFLGVEFTATQDDTTLTVVPTNHPVHVGERPQQFWSRHHLDGSESRLPLESGPRTVERVSVTRWDGARLVITSTMTSVGNESTQVQTWVLDPSGDLIVDAVSTSGGATTSTRATYRKVNHLR